MNDHTRGQSDDNLVMRELRELHAPPGGDSYWAGLEARIMARIGLAESMWGSECGRLARPALAAAAAHLIAARSATLQALHGEQREETLRFLITY